MNSDRNPKPVRLGVLLSGGGRTLMNILDEIAAGRLDAEVAVVNASRECKGIGRSQDAGLDVRLVGYKSFKGAGGTAESSTPRSRRFWTQPPPGWSPRRASCRCGRFPPDTRAA